ncbi:hypothetical protein M0R04_04270 [Candidatus Dojkabacteria bacterium]|jgi:hypothetical protein|nr:hypothetical protein [Candidatus Dojkabacteria bacterium]
MSSEKLYSEIFEDFQNAGTREDKINVLRKYDHPRFRYFFQLLYSPRVEFDVEIPSYRPAVEPAGLNWTYLDTEMEKIYRFIKNHNKRTNVQPNKLKNLLGVVLESLHKDEAIVLINLMKKDLGIKYLTPKIVSEAFPGLDLS